MVRYRPETTNPADNTKPLMKRPSSPKRQSEKNHIPARVIPINLEKTTSLPRSWPSVTLELAASRTNAFLNAFAKALVVIEAYRKKSILRKACQTSGRALKIVGEGM